MSSKNSYWRKFKRAGFAFAIVLTLVLANLPQPPRFAGIASDVVQHAAGFAALTIAARLAYPEVGWRPVLIGLALLGLGIELVQGMLPFGRNASWSDWLVDCLAIMATLLGTGLCQRLCQHLSPLRRRKALG